MQTTIIIICYNWTQYLEDAIENVLAQTTPIEIMVMTDGSTPEVEQIASKYDKVSVISLPVARNNIARLNTTVALVDTPYYLMLCVDDFLAANYVKKAEEVLEDASIDVVHCDIEKFGLEDGRWDSIGLVPGIKENNTMFFSSVVRKSLWEKLGGYDEEIPYALLEDWDFWVRAYYAKAKSYHLPMTLYKYRIHDGQMSRTTVPAHAGEIMPYLQEKWSKYA